MGGSNQYPYRPGGFNNRPVLPNSQEQANNEAALRAQLAAVMDSNRTEQQQQQQHHLPQSHPYQQIQPAVQQQQMPQGYADMQQSVSGHNIDPAIAGAHHALEMMNTDAGNSNAGGSGCESDQQQTIKQKKELASSKRAAQNRAAQVCCRDFPLVFISNVVPWKCVQLRCHPIVEI